jgi:hypothetical protein
MHWNAEQILWATVLAAHLVLLVVLLGKDRSSRFPWFTVATAFSAVHLIVDHLLNGKLTTVAFYWQSYSAILVSSVLAVLVLAELARRVFSSGKAGLILKPKGWAGWIMLLAGLTAVAVWFWGPWPSLAALKAQPQELPLLLTVLTAIKSQLFVGLLTVEVGLLMRIFGKRFGFGWKSHPEQIALGLSTYALGYLAVLATTDIIKHTVHLTSRAQYDHIVKLFERLDDARFALWLLVLIWWCVWLWRDDPDGSATSGAAEGAPVLAGPPTLEGEATTDEADSIS